VSLLLGSLTSVFRSLFFGVRVVTGMIISPICLLVYLSINTNLSHCNEYANT
jgi:hypothetical protein